MNESKAWTIIVSVGLLVVGVCGFRGCSMNENSTNRYAQCVETAFVACADNGGGLGCGDASHRACSEGQSR